MEQLNYYHTQNLRYIPTVYHGCSLQSFDFAGNRHLIEIIKKFVEGEISGLYLQGGFGVGKTHLAVSLYRILVAKLDDSTTQEIFFTSWNQLIEDIKSGDDYIVDLLIDCGILFLDDISTCQPKDSELLRRIISGRYERHGRLVVTSNVRIDSLSLKDGIGLHLHAVSRLHAMCTVVEVKGSDRRRKN